MIKYLREYRFYILLFLFLLIPITAIDTTNRAPREYRLYDRAILLVTAPIQKSITWLLDGAVSGFQNYIYLWHTRQDNLALVEENRKLISTIASLQETQQENTRLKHLLNFQERFHLETIPARVIARDVSSEFRALRINRGESSGIFRNMAVVSSEGVVGRILRTTATTADVVTILDLQSAIDALIERSRARGIVEGLTNDTAQLKFALRTDDIQVGDHLVSSGLGGVFPKGAPVGSVLNVKRPKYGISQDVEIRPAVDFSKLEEVLVVTRQHAEMLALREKTTQEKAPEKPKEHP